MLRMHVFSVGTGKQHRKLMLPYVGSKGCSIFYEAQSEWGQLVTGDDTGMVMIWNIESGAALDRTKMRFYISSVGLLDSQRQDHCFRGRGRCGPAMER
ncbi:hypothetical protein VTI74DRAFT_78 [Chaetomium olivicolor]